MELVEKTDEEGNRVLFKRYIDRTFNKDTPGDVADHLEKVASLQYRPDDVLLCTFPKSGTHWMFNIAKMILNKTLRYNGSPVILDFQNVDVLNTMTSPRIFTTHMTYPFIPKAAMDGQMKIIYVVRNPKDVAISYYRFLCDLENTSFTGSFAGYLKVFLSEETPASGGSWFTHTKEWVTGISQNQHLNILPLRFEDMTKNLYHNLLRIEDFLEVDHDETFLRNVERTVTFENLRKQHATGVGESEMYKHHGDNGRLPIYRKGIVGDWKNAFTVAQSETFDLAYNEKMSDLDITFDWES